MAKEGWEFATIDLYTDDSFSNSVCPKCNSLIWILDFLDFFLKDKVKILYYYKDSRQNFNT